MDSDGLRSDIARLGPWHHRIELAPGVSTIDDDARAASGSGDAFIPGTYAPDLMIRPIVDQVFGGSMAGRSFLDCGCNAGGHVFAAARLGAGRCFGFDARQHWIDQAEFLKRHLPGGRIDFARCELADLPGLGLERFDVTMFGGLFYHLPDPVAGLRVAADHTSELLVVTTSVLPRAGKALVLKQESTTQFMSGVDGVSWLPTGAAVVRDILAWCGFPHSRVDADFSATTKAGWRRVHILAARDEATFAAYDKLRPDAAAGETPSLGRRLLRRLGLGRRD
ncbi:MAG TPA: methyltransferase domain-containing protein [Allosphingosinicella sp.]|nr:methyltransferase domain-containing protein [Allosphingosinicella sp.]